MKTTVYTRKIINSYTGFAHLLLKSLEANTVSYEGTVYCIMVRLRAEWTLKWLDTNILPICCTMSEIIIALWRHHYRKVTFLTDKSIEYCRFIKLSTQGKDSNATMYSYMMDPFDCSGYVAWRAGTTTLCHAIDNFIPPVRDYELGLRSVFKSLETMSLLISFSPISFMIQFKGFLLSEYVIYTRKVWPYLSPVIRVIYICKTWEWRNKGVV
jgi:hypothetical protein